MSAGSETPQVWHEQFYGRDFAVMGRLVSRGPEGIENRDVLIATVNPNIPQGADVARDIASALNEKFPKETENV